MYVLLSLQTTYCWPWINQPSVLYSLQWPLIYSWLAIHSVNCHQLALQSCSSPEPHQLHFFTIHVCERYKIKSVQLSHLLPLFGFFFLLEQTYMYYSKFCAGRLGLAVSLQSCLLCGMGSIARFKEGLQLPNCLVHSKLHLVTVLNYVVLCVHVCMSLYMCVCGHVIICVCESVCMCAWTL